MSDTQFFLLVGFVGFVALIIASRIWWQHSHSIRMIERWASKNGLQLVSSRRCYWTLGTPLSAPRGCTVYRITVEDSVGNRMSGYALCGSFWHGLLSECVEVKWDDSPGVEKRKNDDLAKPKNDFLKRKNDWDSPDFGESETVDLEDLRNDSVKRKNRD